MSYRAVSPALGAQVAELFETQRRLERRLEAHTHGGAEILTAHMAGTTATAAEYQAALDAAVAAGKALYHPGGVTADFGSTILSVPDKAIILGDGPTSLIEAAGNQLGAAAAYAFMENDGWGALDEPRTRCDEILISGLRFRYTGSLLGTEGPYNACIRIRNARRNVVIERCTFEGAMSGVTMEGGEDWEIRHCVGYSQGDSSFRIVEGAGGHDGVRRAQRGVVRSCWAFNSGYELDGVTTVPEPAGPLGSSFIFHQENAALYNCGAVNPRKNSVETGGAVVGMLVQNFHIYVDISGRVGNILVANTGQMAIRATRIEIHNGGSAGVTVSGDIGAAGNTIGQHDIVIDGVTAYNSHVAAGFNPAVVNISRDCPNIVVSGVRAYGMTITTGLDSASQPHRGSLIDCIVVEAPARGITAAGGVWNVENCRAINCGTDSARPASERVGIVLDGIQPGSRVTRNHAEDTRLTAAAPTIAAGGAGSLSGFVRASVTFVVAGAESGHGLKSAAVNLSSNEVDWSDIPLGPAGTTARKLYRTATGDSDGIHKLVATISDNTTTVFTDNVANGSLGAASPATQRTQQHGYYSNGGEAIWDLNTESNSVVSAHLKTSSPVINAPTYVT